MHQTPFRRAVALVLCCQPVFWMSSTALAQSLQDSAGGRRTEQSADPLEPRQGGDPFGSRETTDPFDLQGSSRSRDGADGADADSLSFSLSPGGAAASGEAGAQGRTSAMSPVIIGPPLDAPVDPESYVCGPGDLFELNFWGQQNLKLRMVVDVEGRAFLPKIGYLDLRGKTLAQARRAMRETVSRHYPRLGFDATLAQPRTFQVQVASAVKRPGTYPARAVDRVAAVVLRAGGFGPKASTRRIEVRRRDGTVVQADLLRYAQTGDVKYNPFLLDGDIVRVPYEELAASVEGAVNRPGRYELIGTRDLAELVEVAGGLAPTATNQLPISLVRRLADDRQDQQLVQLGADRKLPTLALQHEDAVRIPDFVELQRSVMVVGALRDAKPPTAGAGGAVSDEATATRRLAFAQGDTVRTLLERVGGVGQLADLEGSYLLRGGKSIPVDLYKLVMLRDLNADRPIELGDTLVVPFKRRNILVQGAVFTPGSYPYNPTYGVEQYLALAGGRNRFAQSLSDVRVITANGEVKDFRRDLQVEPGSSLVVPERNFSRAEVVQIALGVASVLVSGVAVVLAARK